MPTKKMLKSEVKEYFNSASKEYFYEREEEYAFGIQKRIALRMLETMNGKGGKVIDIGCGSGLLTIDLLKRGYNVWGIDVSEEMISNAEILLKERNIGDNNVHYSLGDIENLNFPDDFFNAVISIGVLEYLTTYNVALKEIYRVLGPGGIAIISLPSRISPFYIPLKFAEKAIFPIYHTLKRLLTNKSSGLSPKVNPCIPWKFDHQLEKTGFKKLESEFCFFIFYPIYPFFPKLSINLSKKLALISKSKLLGWLGTQYIIKAVKK